MMVSFSSSACPIELRPFGGCQQRRAAKRRGRGADSIAAADNQFEIDAVKFPLIFEVEQVLQRSTATAEKYGDVAAFGGNVHELTFLTKTWPASVFTASTSSIADVARLVAKVS